LVTDALLHAAVARARSELVALDLCGCTRVTFDALLAAVTANGGALRELRVCGVRVDEHEDDDDNDTPNRRHMDALEALLRAAPRLAVCEADVVCHELALAHSLLRNESPFAPLHVRSFTFEHVEGERHEAAVLALAADTASHAHLRRLQLAYAPLNTAAALNAVVDAASTRRLTSVALRMCNLSRETAPALVRLIGSGALAELDIFGEGRALLDAASARALGNALRASGTLTSLSLRLIQLWLDPAAAMALLGAVTGHPSLRSLDISSNKVYPADREEAGATLGALVAANAPALTTLGLLWCSLGVPGLGPLFDALPANTHLRILDCSHNGESNAFASERLLPAVRANSSLRKIKLGVWRLQTDGMREAAALVQRRAAADAE
jgi:hypothetical protein